METYRLFEGRKMGSGGKTVYHFWRKIATAANTRYLDDKSLDITVRRVVVPVGH